MATIDELRILWHARRATFSESGAKVDGVRLADLVLAELDGLEQARDTEAVTLKEAQAIGGFSIDHLQRLVASGQIENVGRKHRPRIRRSDVPIKPGHHLPTGPDDVSSARRRIVASVAKHGSDKSS